MFNTRISIGSPARRLLAASTLGLALAVAAAPTATADPKAPRTACAGGELDNCYSENQMGEFLQVGEQMVSDYLTHIGVRTRPKLVYIAEGHSVNGACKDDSGSRIQGPDAYDYCGADNTVYIGQHALWGYYHQYGAAGPIAGLAHEHGHYLQALAHVPQPQTATGNIPIEDQADCVAGDFVGYLRTLGDVEYPKDYRNLGDFLRSIGSREEPGRDHGTPTERVRIFEKGLFGGIAACNAFFPSTPLTR